MGAVQAIPADLQPETPINWQIVDDKTQLFVPAFGRGADQRQSFGDPYWRARMKFRGLRQADRARLIASLMDTQGQFNVLRVAPYAPILGSFATYCPEMFANNTFASGTTGWGGYSDFDVSVTDQVYRAVSKGTTQNGTTPPLVGTYPVYQSPTTTTTANAPYAVRLGYRSAGGNGGQSVYSFQSVQQRLSGYGTGIYAPVTTYDPGGVQTVCFNVDDNLGTLGLYVGGGPKGAWIEVYYASCARCMQLDHPVNLLPYSLDMTNAAWNKSQTGVITEGSTTDPDGNNNACRVTPTASSGLHFIYQSQTVTAGVQDFVFMVAARANGYNYVALDMNASSSAVNQCFNLTAGGSVGSGGTLGVWANKRAFTVNLGMGWVLCVLIARKTTSATAVQFAVLVNSTDTAQDSYSANGTSGVQLYLPTAQPSSYAGRLVNTGATPANEPTLTGAYLPVKGLPVSQSGLLLPGAWVEAAGELKQVVSSLDSDSAGRGILHVRPEFTGGSGLINAPVIVRNPMGRFLASIPSGIDNLYGLYSDVELDLREVYSD